jgi:membrane protein implicated in regulation of membrane protease activity
MSPQSGNGAKSAPIVLVASILVGAVMVAVIGTFVPGLASITGAPAFWIPIAFYAIAVADVLVALWLWRKLKGMRQSSSRGGGPVQRQ